MLRTPKFQLRPEASHYEGFTHKGQATERPAQFVMKAGCRPHLGVLLQLISIETTTKYFRITSLLSTFCLTFSLFVCTRGILNNYYSNFFVVLLAAAVVVDVSCPVHPDYSK